MAKKHHRNTKNTGPTTKELVEAATSILRWMGYTNIQVRQRWEGDGVWHVWADGMVGTLDVGGSDVGWLDEPFWGIDWSITEASPEQYWTWSVKTGNATRLY